MKAHRPFTSVAAVGLSAVVVLTLWTCGEPGSTGLDEDPLDRVATVTVSPDAVTVDVGATAQLAATVLNGHGEAVSTAVSWSISEESIATVAGGIVTGVSEGTATVTATADGKLGTSTVTVVDPTPDTPSDVQASAVSNTEMDVTWTDGSNDETEFRIERETTPSAAGASSSNAAFVQVGSVGSNVTSFRDTGLSAGTTYRYRVLSCNQSGCSAPSPVSTGVPTHSTLVITTTSLPDGVVGIAYEAQLEAEGGGGALSWAVVTGSAPDGLALSSTGVLSGLPLVDGSFEFGVEVESPGQTATNDLPMMVNRPDVATVEILGVPEPELLPNGSTTALGVRVLDGGGAELDGLPVEWETSDPLRAQVSGGGVVSGLGNGRVTVTATVYDVSASQELLVATPPQPFLLEDWVPIGPDFIPGRLGPGLSGKLQAIAVARSNPSVIYAGGGLGSGNQGPWTEPGAFKSMNGGTSWTEIHDGLTDRVVNAVWVDPENENTVLVGTDRGGLFRSVDGGASWTLVSSTPPISEILTTDEGLLAAAGPGVIWSEDAGATWQIVHETSAPVRALDVVGGVAVAGLENGTVLHRPSTDDFWTEVATHGSSTIWSVAINPTATNMIWLTLNTSGVTRVRRSLDSGASWTDMAKPCGISQSFRYVPGTSTLLLGCNGSLRRSTNGGTDWTQVPDAFWDIRKVFVEDDGTILLGTDQGLHRSDDGGTTWDPLTASTRTAIIYGLSVLDETILTAPQDFSPILSFDGGSSWEHPSATSPATAPHGENGQLLINPLSPANCYAMTVSGFQTSSDGCHTWTSPRSLGGFPYVQPGHKDIIAVDPASPSRVYFATSLGLMRSDNHGLTLTTIPGPFTETTGVAVHPSEPDILIVGATNGLFRSEDGGTSWSDPIALPLAGYPSSVAFHPTQPDIVVVTTHLLPVFGGGVARSLDAGRTFSVAMDGIDRPHAGVPFASSPALSFSETGALAYATLDGISLSLDLAESWEDLTPDGITFFGDVDWDGGTLYGATAGSGVLKASILPSSR